MSNNCLKRLKLDSSMDNNSHKLITIDPKTKNILVQCTLCNKNCDTETQLEIHQSSKAHLKKLEAFNEKAASATSLPTIGINNSEYNCEICNVKCNTKQQLDIHKTGKTHQRKSMKYNFKDFPPNVNNLCLNNDSSSDTTNMIPEVSSSNGHIGESKSEMDCCNNQMQIDDVQSIECTVKKAPELDPVITDLLQPLREPNKITCRLCNNSTNTEEQHQAHCKGSKHIKRLQSLGVPTDVFEEPTCKDISIEFEKCMICNITIHKNNMESHNKGKTHKEKLIKSKVIESNEIIVKKSNLSMDLKNELKNQPRKYQLEIYEKALQSDCVIFLPTGTGKTMIAAMLILKMLEENPHHRVAFIVDKVLLVMQQRNYLHAMFENVLTDRFISQSETSTRRLKVIGLANEFLDTEYDCIIRDHDIIVATAELFRNSLKNQQFSWIDFSLVILDEAHHCVKEHPYNKLLSEYHLYPVHVLANSNNSSLKSFTNHDLMKPLVDQKKMEDWKIKRCKLIGLTASPAGDVNEENTYKMLETLMESLGDVDIASVTNNIEELQEYTSMIQIETKMINYTDKEFRLRTLISENFVFLLHKFERHINSIGNGIIANQNNPLSIELVGNLKSQLSAFLADMEYHHKHILNHILSLVSIIEAIDSIGYQIALTKFKELTDNENDKVWYDNNVFNFSANSKKIFESDSESDNELSELSKSSIVSTIIEQAKALDEENRTVLLLVKERQIAKSLQTALKMQIDNFEVLLMTGHGIKGTKNNKGMSVTEQKKALNFIREKKSKIIVATSVLDEGIDLPECDLVIIISPPNSVQALVQIRGRARKKSSRLLMLCRDQQSIDDLEKLKLQEANISKSINKMLASRKSIAV